MARAIVWPQIAPPAPPEPKAAAHGLDLAGLAAAFGPELARRIGIRVTALPDMAGPAELSTADGSAGDSWAGDRATVLLGRIPLGSAKGAQGAQTQGAQTLHGQDAGAQALQVGAPPACAEMLLERLFGARAPDAAKASGAGLFTLPPGSASWLALCRTVCGAVAAALAAGGRAAAGSPAFPPRAISLPTGPLLSLTLDADGIPGRILLLAESALPAPAPAAPDRALFRQAVRARAFDLELPVALRIAEQRISLLQASRLAVGDILPIDPVHALDVLAGGRAIARLPASAFTPEAKASGDDQ